MKEQVLYFYTRHPLRHYFFFRCEGRKNLLVFLHQVRFILKWYNIFQADLLSEETWILSHHYRQADIFINGVEFRSREQMEDVQHPRRLSTRSEENRVTQIRDVGLINHRLFGSLLLPLATQNYQSCHNCGKAITGFCMTKQHLRKRECIAIY